MDKILNYRLEPGDLEKTAGGLVNLVLKNCIHVTGHEISTAKFTPGGITCDGSPVRVSDRIRVGQTLQVILPEREDTGKIIPTEGALCVLYEDEDLLIVNKAPGEVVHPCPGHYADTAANHAAWYLECHGGDASGSLRIAGRLDKETSGVLVFAKNRAAAARLAHQRKNGTFIRTYLAVCEGTFPPEERTGIIDRPLEKLPGDLMRMRVVPEEGSRAEEKNAAEDERVRAPRGNSHPGPDVLLNAVTRYEVLSQTTDRSLLRIVIDTGRTHQIRVHLAAAGHPLVGDTLYGPDAQPSDHTKSMPDHAESMPETGARVTDSRALLHAGAVRLRQPFTGEEIRIRAALPADFREAAEVLLPRTMAGFMR